MMLSYDFRFCSSVRRRVN